MEGEGSREYYALPDRIIMSVFRGIMSADPISSGQRFRGIEKLLSTEGLTFNEIRQTLANLGIFSLSLRAYIKLNSWLIR